jgi:hypothetical protein
VAFFFPHEFSHPCKKNKEKQKKQREAAKGTMMGVFWKNKWVQVVTL